MALQIDQMLWRGQPGFHHRDQAVAAGQGAGVFAELHQKRDGIGDGFRTMVVK